MKRHLVAFCSPLRRVAMIVRLASSGLMVMDEKIYGTVLIFSKSLQLWIECSLRKGYNDVLIVGLDWLLLYTWR